MFYPIIASDEISAAMLDGASGVTPTRARWLGSAVRRLLARLA
jgi:hypothetical protein